MKKKNFSETNAVPAKKNKASPKKAMLIIGIVAGVLGLVSAATVAFLTDRTDPVVNEFGGSVVDCLVVEEFDGETKSDVAVQNTGDTKSYVRAAVIVTWMSEDKSSVTAKVPAEGVDYDIVMDDSLWKKGADGYWYYTKAIDPDEQTGILVKSASLREGAAAPDGFFLSVEIAASAIQAEPGTAVCNIWADGVASADGETLTVK